MSVPLPLQGRIAGGNFLPGAYAAWLHAFASPRLFINGYNYFLGTNQLKSYRQFLSNLLTSWLAALKMLYRHTEN